jgi:FtsH-binding integral membrane protein
MEQRRAVFHEIGETVISLSLSLVYIAGKISAMKSKTKTLSQGGRNERTAALSLSLSLSLLFQSVCCFLISLFLSKKRSRSERVLSSSLLVNVCVSFS